MNIKYVGSGYTVEFDCRNIIIDIDAADPINTVTMNIDVFNNASQSFEQMPDFPKDYDGDITDVVTIIEPLEDGIYKLAINGDPYYLFNICSIIDCKVNLIKDAVCSVCETDDCRAKAYYKLNEFNVLWTTYLSMISQNDVNFDFVGDSLIPYADLIDIVELDKLINRISDLCNDCEGFIETAKSCN